MNPSQNSGTLRAGRDVLSPAALTLAARTHRADNALVTNCDAHTRQMAGLTGSGLVGLGSSRAATTRRAAAATAPAAAVVSRMTLTGRRQRPTGGGVHQGDRCQLRVSMMHAINGRSFGDGVMGVAGEGRGDRRPDPRSLGWIIPPPPRAGPPAWPRPRTQIRSRYLGPIWAGSSPSSSNRVSYTATRFGC